MVSTVPGRRSLLTVRLWADAQMTEGPVTVCGYGLPAVSGSLVSAALRRGIVTAVASMRPHGDSVPALLAGRRDDSHLVPY